jgi:hypothetical protein
MPKDRSPPRWAFTRTISIGLVEIVNFSDGGRRYSALDSFPRRLTDFLVVLRGVSPAQRW